MILGSLTCMVVNDGPKLTVEIAFVLAPRHND